jgi:hypothetical protein
MRSVRPAVITAMGLATAWLAAGVSAQTSHTPRSPRPGASGVPATPPPSPAPITVPGLVVTMEVRATAPALAASPSAALETQALAARLKGTSSVRTRVWLAQDLSRQEVLSRDSVLPPGTLVMHKAGDRLYVIADPLDQTYVVMDSQALLDALEGSGGVVNSQYEARIQHTDERKTIAGLPCRKSVLIVNYISSIPVENDRVSVQQRNDVAIWHTSALVSSAALEQLFFKFQQDRLGAVQKAVASEIGFPMEIDFVVTQGAGKRNAVPAPGSLHVEVTEVRREPRLEADLFRIPPAGFRRTDKNRYFAAAGVR